MISENLIERWLIITCWCSKWTPRCYQSHLGSGLCSSLSALFSCGLPGKTDISIFKNWRLNIVLNHISPRGYLYIYFFGRKNARSCVSIATQCNTYLQLLMLYRRKCLIRMIEIALILYYVYSNNVYALCRTFQNACIPLCKSLVAL